MTKLTPTQASKISGIPAQAIRVQMVSGKLDLGFVLPGKKNMYYIYPAKLAKLMGLTAEEMDEEIRKLGK